MGEAYGVPSGAVALAANTPKTVIEVTAPATASARVIMASVTFDAAPTTAPTIELVRYAATGTGTAFTPIKKNGEGQARASLCTAKVNDTVEPTTAVPVEGYYSGLTWQYPLQREAYLPPGTVIGLRVTSPTAINCRALLDFEE